MNKQKKLIEILYEDNFEFPDGYDYVAQDKCNMEIWYYSNDHLILRQGDTIWDTKIFSTITKLYCKHTQLASDWDSSIVTRQQYKDYCEKQNKEKNMKPNITLNIPKLTIDKDNPVWVNVWDEEEEKEDCETLLLVAMCGGGGCICVHKYAQDKVLETGNVGYDDFYCFKKYEIIEETPTPKQTHRPFKDYEEFREWLKSSGRTNLILEDKSENCIYTKGFNTHSKFTDIFDNYKWFDTQEPVGMPFEG